MEMIEVKTAELVGPALDWAVAHALGYSDGEDAFCNPAWLDGDRYVTSKHLFRPSTDWSQGGPLIEKCGIEFEWITDATLRAEIPTCASSAFGQGHLVAACRAIVAAKLGATVQVPAQLVEGKA